MSKKVTAAMVVIGNEILSGRTQDKNINYVANKLSERGITFSEVRIIPDVEAVIVKTVNELRETMDYVFTSGGIGPTHDDITADSVAKAFNVPIEQNSEAYDILLSHYGAGDLTEARLKMARIPVGGSLIPNPVSAAPGFQIGNVFVMAGVPRIMQAMMDHVCVSLAGGDVVLSRTVPSTLPESVIAKGLGDIQDTYPSVDIGSYPHFHEGNLGVSVVLRSSDEQALNKAEEQVFHLLKRLETQ